MIAETLILNLRNPVIGHKMSRINTSDISTLLERWSATKKQISILEEKIEKYKRVANRIMKQQNCDVLYGDDHTLKRKHMSRSTVNKRDLPEHIWDKYARECNYKAYYLTDNR